MRLRNRLSRVRRGALRRLGAEGGFTIVEMLASGMLLLLVSAPLASVLTSAAVVQRMARERTGADHLAAAQIERVRSTPYDSIGTTSGNPPGNFAPTQQLNVGGVPVQLKTQIAFVDDPAPGTFRTSADYKKVTVTVTRVNGGRQLAKKPTFVSATGAPPFGGINQVTIKANVIDSVLNVPLQDASVSLATGPSAPRTDTTDAAGFATFPALAANPASGSQMYYDVSASLAGYTTHPSDVSPAAAAHVQIAPGQTWSTVIRMYRVGTTLSLHLLDSNGTLYTGTATVTVGSNWGGQTFTITGGSLTVTALNGVPLIPGVTYSISAQTPAGRFAPLVTTLAPASYPTNMTAGADVSLPATTYTVRTLTVAVKTAAGANVTGARVEVSGGSPNTYFYGTTSSGGTVVFSVGAGTTTYNISVTGASGTGTGTATVNTTNVTSTITVH